MASSATSALRNRDNGRRADVKHRGKAVDQSFLGVTNLGANRLNLAQIYEIERLYSTHPAVQAARTVLHAQLFSGGVALFRDGKVQTVKKDGNSSKSQRTSNGAASSAASSSNPTRAPSESGDDANSGVQETFQRHLSTHWLSFAKDVADSFLKWGYAVVVFDLESEEPAKRAARLAKAEEGISGPSRKRSEPTVAKRLIPRVPTLGTYEVGYDHVGRFGYTRTFKVYAQVPGQSMQEDEQAIVFVRQDPDSVGNVNSPLASVYELGSFVHSITELAMVAEVSRATPQIVTQLRPPVKTAGLDPGALFFDSESRNVQAGQDTEESQSAAHALEMQAQLCRIINNLQTTNREPGQPGASASTHSYHPPDIQPKLFTIPKDQELAPSNKPEARSDLEALQRLSIEQIGAAMGVPASLIFEGRYAGKSTQQLSLLNSTISQLAKSVNDVLTKTYLALYPDESTNSLTGTREESPDTNLELKLRTAPLSASEEVIALYGANLIDAEVAVPAVMHALGSTPDEIDAAMERTRAKEEKDCQCEDESRDMEMQQKKVALETSKVNLKNAKAAPPPGAPSSSSSSSSSSSQPSRNSSSSGSSSSSQGDNGGSS